MARDLPLQHFYQGRILNFAHRGARRQAPENTLPAFERAAEIGADGIELDIQLCADKEVVVFHDLELGRTCEGSGPLRNFPLAQLRELDAGVYFAPGFAGTSIPTLREVFEAVGSRVLINVEIKPFVNEPEAAELVAGLIRSHGLTRRVLVSSFNPLILRRMRRVAPELALGFLHDDSAPYPIRFETVVRPIIGSYQARHPHFSDVTARYVSWTHRRGYRINTWTVNEPVDIRRMIDLGVDMIISDVPDVVRDVMQGTNAGSNPQ